MKALQNTSGCKYEKDVKHQKIFNVKLRILLQKIYLVDWELKRPKKITLYQLQKRFKIWFYRLEMKQDIQR